jgi:hypothetical protein
MYDFSTLYERIPCNKLKSMHLQIIDICFLNKSSTRKYTFQVIEKQGIYFVRNHSDCPHKYSEGEIGFLVDIIYIVVEDQVF